MPDLHRQKENAIREMERAKKQIEIIHQEHKSELLQQQQQHQVNLRAKDVERVQMRKDFDLEYDVLNAIIK